MKKKIVVSVCLAAIFVVGGICVNLFNFAGLSGDELLLENVEALTNNETESKPKICHKAIRSCTCYRPVEEYTCVSPLNCSDVSVTSCVSGCSCY